MADTSYARYHLLNEERPCAFGRFVCVLQMAGNELVGPKGRCLIGQAVLSLHRGHNNRVPVESVAGALDGLGPEQRGWLDAAAAESQQI